MEFIKTRYNKGLPANFYFYRDSQQNEIDLVFKRGADLVPVEIKAAKTFNSSFLDGLNSFKKIVGERCQEGYIIYSGKEEQKIGSFSLLNYQHVKKIFN